LIAVVGEYPPYVSRTEINANMAREIVEEAFDAVGYNLEFRWVPWKRAYEELKIGKADISFPLLKTEERESFLIYSDPIYSSKELFIYKRVLDFKWQDINDLKNYRVGGSLGYEHVDTLISKGINVEIAQNDKSNILKILSGRIDIFPVDPRVANFLMSDMDTTSRAVTVMSEKA
ncbi:TPA: transporter substrate-binding domain-containing protein, partial [Vibrio cholerae]|nr:transporter substrate-binding domain-containing protein [Vibrio cholerae]